MNNEQPIEVTTWGIKCDSETCDWSDPTIKYEQYESLINMACPKCGENVLTYQDFLNAKELHDMVDFFNSLNEEELEGLAKTLPLEAYEELKAEAAKGNKIQFQVETHGEIKFKRVYPDQTETA